MNPFWLLRMSQWARRRPQMWQVKLIIGLAAAMLVIVGIEWMGWWPEWATAEPVKRRL